MAFRALIAHRADDGSIHTSIEYCADDFLVEGDRGLQGRHGARRLSSVVRRDTVRGRTLVDVNR
jgi:hypothetical protein